jgi:hypothetical protein
VALCLPRRDQFGQVIDVFDSPRRDVRVEEPVTRWVVIAFDELALMI